MASVMLTFVTVLIYDSSCSRTLLEWTISDVDDERTNIESFYKVALTQEYYPQCEDCQDKQKILKKKN